jgi:hypothetical protein
MRSEQFEAHSRFWVGPPGRQNSIHRRPTSLVLTILEIAGVAPAAAMRGPSLLPWCGRDGVGTGEGVAFAQFLYGNPVPDPIDNGRPA